MPRSPRTQPPTRRPALSDAALVLRRYPYGETSLVVRLLTPRHGKVSLLAKGAYRPTSGYCGLLDFFDTLDLTWTQAPGQELGVLVSGQLGTRRRGLTRDLARYRTGLALLEVAGLAAQEDHPERELFGLVEGTLGYLASGAVAPELAQPWFDLAFLRLQGLAPALERCAVCGRDPGERTGIVAFAALVGGRLCKDCATRARAGGRRVDGLPLNLVRIARSLMNTPSDMLPRTRLAPDALGPVEGFVRRFLETHLETRLRRP